MAGSQKVMELPDFSRIFHESSKDLAKGHPLIPADSSEWPDEWKTTYYKAYPRLPDCFLYSFSLAYKVCAKKSLKNNFRKLCKRLSMNTNRRKSSSLVLGLGESRGPTAT